jgi:fructose-1,6-bisphosphatase/inositol monophosphatase family enzyme
MSERLLIAQKALLAGAVPVKQFFGRSMAELSAKFKFKNEGGLQTLIDITAEKEILSVIRSSRFKDDNIAAEESGASKGTGNYTWYVDPLDGTRNVPINLPMSVLGIGVSDGNQVVVSAILNPFDMEMVYAERGEGAWWVPLGFENDKFYISGDPRQAVPSIPDKPKQRYAWVDAIFNEHTAERKAAWLREMPQFAMNIRAGGSNVDKPMKLARGKGQIQLTDCVGGFHDLAPGVVILSEMGGRMVDLDGNEPKPDCKIVIGCVDPNLIGPLLEMTRRHYGSESPLGSYRGHRG